jgi:autotransporter-associated beta strand protein
LGGQLYFHGNASAGNAIFINKGSPFYDFCPNCGAGGGTVAFYDNTTASDGIFQNDGGAYPGAFGGGNTRFDGNSSAGNATLIAKASTTGGNGGAIVFYSSSTGGTARVELSGNADLDISPHAAPGVTIGSLNGVGDVFLGANNLTLGSNNLSTTFAGVIRDGGGLTAGTGGSLTKIGTGTLNLSSPNTYTGGTIVNAGRLMANNSPQSSTGPGGVTVNNGGVLGGTGKVNGSALSVSTGGALLGGDATVASGGLTIASNLTLNAGSIIQLVLGALGDHSSLHRTGGTWTFAPSQRFTFIDVGAQPGFYDNILTGIPDPGGAIASWAITNAGFVGTFSYDGANIDLNITSASGPALKVVSAVSRKTHGTAGDFDIPLPLTGEPGVECRAGNGTYKLVFTFNNDVVSGNASISFGTGRTASTTFAGNTMTANLTGIADVQKVTVTLSNVMDSFSQVLPDTPVNMNVLVGDVSGNKSVNATDVSQTRLQSGMVASAVNFRADINASGIINASDVSQVKLQVGDGLP